MTSIDSISGSSQVWQQPPPRPDDGNDPMSKALSGVADKLGMSVDDIRKAQKDGTNLAQLAQQKGVSVDDITTTLAQGLKANAPADAPADADTTQMATDIVNGKGPGGGGHHHGHHKMQGTGENSSSGDLSSLLNQFGIDSSQLTSILESSTSGSSTSSDASSTSNTSTSSTTLDGSQTDDFVTQLKTLMNQYGSKGLSYDSQL